MVVPCFSNNIPDLDWIPQNAWNGELPENREIYQVYLSEEHRQVLLLGLGTDQESTNLYQSFKSLLIKYHKFIPDELVVDLRQLPENILYHCVFGFGLAEYDTGSYKTKVVAKKNPNKVKLLISGVSQKQQDQLKEARATAEVVNRVCALVDAPPNIKIPAFLGQWAVESGKKFGYQVEVLDHNELEAKKLDALLAVGQGSKNQPLLITMRYQGDQSDSKSTTLGLVGKGVTFDTGGLSIKKATNMHYMKSDMGGAAAVLGAMELIARLAIPLNVTAVVPVAENSVDARSIRPGDVIGSHSGKTIEIIDTDAEGRLILADGLSYIQDQHQPDVLVDLATLTGSCVAALGYEAAGLFSNQQELSDQLSQAGTATGERVWPLPLWDGYSDALYSDVADLKNLSGKPVAGAITAAKFLEAFVKDLQPWAHLDIAGVAFGDTEQAKMKSATGYGVRLLVQLAKEICKTKK